MSEHTQDPVVQDRSPATIRRRLMKFREDFANRIFCSPESYSVAELAAKYFMEEGDIYDEYGITTDVEITDALNISIISDLIKIWLVSEADTIKMIQVGMVASDVNTEQHRFMTTLIGLSDRIYAEDTSIDVDSFANRQHLRLFCLLTVNTVDDFAIFNAVLLDLRSKTQYSLFGLVGASEVDDGLRSYQLSYERIVERRGFAEPPFPYILDLVTDSMYYRSAFNPLLTISRFSHQHALMSYRFNKANEAELRVDTPIPEDIEAYIDLCDPMRCATVANDDLSFTLLTMDQVGSTAEEVKKYETVALDLDTDRLISDEQADGADSPDALTEVLSESVQDITDRVIINSHPGSTVNITININYYRDNKDE